MDSLFSRVTGGFLLRRAEVMFGGCVVLYCGFCSRAVKCSTEDSIQQSRLFFFFYPDVKD